MTYTEKEIAELKEFARTYGFVLDLEPKKKPVILLDFHTKNEKSEPNRNKQRVPA